MMVQFVNVSKIYTKKEDNHSIQAVKDVSFSVEQGDICGIIGYSGAGKSTLLRLVNGLEKPTSGEIIVAGQVISDLHGKELRSARQKIGMIFQHFHLLWSRTVRENIAFPLEVNGESKSAIRQRVDYLLERVGLTDRAEAYPAQLSGGQKQRVGIARAIASEPAVLLCDEATSALDPETTASILTLLQEINQELGITILLITHEVGVIRSICKQMVVMDEGVVVENGSVQDILSNPQHPLTKMFVADVEEHEVRSKNYQLTTNDPVVWRNLQKFLTAYQVTMEFVPIINKQELVFRLRGTPERIQKAQQALETGESQVEVTLHVS